MEILVPLGTCVVLPVLMMWLAMRAKQNETNRKAEIMLKALENGADVDPYLFKNKPVEKTLKEKMLGRLTGACVTSLLGVAFMVVGIVIDSIPRWNLGNAVVVPMMVVGGILLAVGISLFIVYSVGKKLLAKELEAEEKSL